jgi:hypothetical protein
LLSSEIFTVELGLPSFNSATEVRRSVGKELKQNKITQGGHIFVNRQGTQHTLVKI